MDAAEAAALHARSVKQSNAVQTDAALQHTHPAPPFPHPKEDDDVPTIWSSAQVLVNLLLCPLCSQPLDPARSLPCGRSVCDACWAACPLDGAMRRCPFSCGKARHWSGIAHDVTLQKVWALIRAFQQQHQQGVEVCEDDDEKEAQSDWSARFLNLLSQALSGQLERKQDYLLDQSPQRTHDTEFDLMTLGDWPEPQDMETSPLLPSVLAELDCQICCAPLFDPLTTPCGHTFCRSCLLRSADHSPQCPMCRATIPPPFANLYHAPCSAVLASFFLNFWRPLWRERQRTIQEEQDLTELFGTADASRLGPGITLPVFVCTLAFPYMPTFLHIFEPRYKLMIRRCVESGDGRFGIVLPKMPTAQHSAGEAQGCPSSTYGTVLRINSVQYLEDGRSLLETTGEDRFRMERWGTRDGYMVGRVELLPDDGTDGDSEAEETSSLFAASDLGFTLSPQDEQLDIAGLLQEATHFIAKLRQGSAPWVLQHLEITHGEIPADPSVFAFWVASLIPVHEEEKYLLLKARGVRTRLRIVLHWVRKLQTQLWFHGSCAVM